MPKKDSYLKAYNFVKSYYNSDGFRQRFHNIDKDWITTERTYNGKNLHYNGKLIKFPLKVKAFININDKKAYYNRRNKNIYMGDIDYLSKVMNKKHGAGHNASRIAAHELGHAVDNSIVYKENYTAREYEPIVSPYWGAATKAYSEIYPIFKNSLSYKKAYNKLLDAAKDEETKKDVINNPINYMNNINNFHDARPSESYGDLMDLRYDLNNKKIYDSRLKDNPFTEEHLKQYKKTGSGNRLFDNFNDEDIIWMMNNVAKNKLKFINNNFNFKDRFNGLTTNNTSIV